MDTDSVFLRKTTKTRIGFLKSETKVDYVKVKLLGYGSRHRGSYAGNHWDYYDALVELPDGKREEVTTEDIFGNIPDTEG